MAEPSKSSPSSVAQGSVTRDPDRAHRMRRSPLPGPYARAAATLVGKGWRAVPVDTGAPGATVKGVTGYKGADPSVAEYRSMARRFADANIGLVMPINVVAIDVDLKGDKDGAQRAAEIMADWPATYSNGHGEPTSPYRHFLYRVPDWVSAEDVASLGQGLGAGIDVIRWMHRWLRVAPSVHGSGEVYYWLDPSGARCKTPRPEDLPQLTEDQWDELVQAAGRSHKSRYEASDVDVEEWLAEHGGKPSKRVVEAFKRHWGEGGIARHGSHYSAMIAAQHELVNLAEEGEPGAERVLTKLRGDYVAYAESEGRDGLTEFERALDSAIGKAVTKTESGDRERERVPEVHTIPNPRAPVIDSGSREPPDVPSTVRAELGEEFSDTWVATRVHGDWAKRNSHVVYSPGLGWLRWNGRRWKPVPEEVIADKVQKYMLEWLANEVNDGVSSERRGRIAALLSKPRQERIARALKVVEVVEATRFDNDHDLLNVGNGIVDLRTGALLPHDQARLMTKIAAVDFEVGATHPDWERAKEALPEAKREYLLDRLGQAATGYTPTDDKVVFLTGSGGNGKSTFVGPVLKALGTYAALVPASLLLGASDRHPAELTTLQGVRFALAEETPEEGRINVQRLKQIAGVGEMTARKMRQDFYTFTQQHSLFVTTNYPPSVTETDHGTWRRLERIAFERKFRGAKTGIDRALRQRVETDREVWTAVLADIVEHAKRYYKDGKIMPEPPVPVAADTQSWRQGEDPLIDFFEQNLEADFEAFISTDELTEAFNEYLRSKSMHQWSPKLLATRIEQHEGLPKMSKARLRTNQKGFSGRFVVARNEKAGQIMVWRGVRWSK